MLNQLSITPWRRMEEWMHRSTFSWPRHYLEVSGQLHAPAALPPGKSPLDLIRDVMSLVWEEATSVSEQISASIFSVETGGSSETQRCFYQTLRCYSPHDCTLKIEASAFSET
jgi:hypothetical protein